MQAIITKYHGPTNKRGSRISAQCARGKMFFPWAYDVDDVANHELACLELRRQFAHSDALMYKTDAKASPWLRPMVCGQIPSGEYVHVFTGAK